MNEKRMKIVSNLILRAVKRYLNDAESKTEE